MPKPDCIIGGMWGTTNLTVYLIDVSSSRVISQKTGPGISRLDGRSPEDALFSLINPWLADYAVQSLQLSGMVGSTIGWVDASYLECPLDIQDIAGRTFDFEARGLPVSVVPGLKCVNPFGHPDVMRGEETELLAWMSGATGAQLKESIVCIPGTHAKWVHVKNRRVETFFTSVVGEVYQVITANGVLAKLHNQKPAQSSQAFTQAIKDISASPENLMNLLFTARANTVTGTFTNAEATEYLSGLLIGADLNAAIKGFGRGVMQQNAVPLIGAEYLTRRYREGLAHWGIESECIRASDIGAAGLFSVWQASKAV